MGLLKSRNDAGGLPAVAQPILAKAEKRRAPRRKSSTKLTCPSPSTSPLEGRVDRWVAALIHWFDTHARKLPWRRTLDPYGIWISEIMLQQTQVKTVIPYWERWMQELPDATALADARPERVLKLWEGLGYYTRARNLQRAAQEIVQQHGGSFPTEFSAILALPGIGRYTAGAISSIAFNHPNPILDGNVIRVLTRLLGIKTNARERKTLERLWAVATLLVQAAGRNFPSGKSKSTSAAAARTSSSGLVSSGPCSRLNQALMELGATLCLPRQPQCVRCPLQQDCHARASGHPEQFPNLGRRLAPTARFFQAFLLEHEGKWLAVQRPANVVNARLWEFPNIEVREGADPARSAQQLLGIGALRQAQGGALNLAPFRTIRHSITRYRIALEAFRMQLQTRPPATPHLEPTARWLSLPDLERLPFASAHRQLLKDLFLD